MAKPDPENALFRPFLLPGDYEKIGAAERAANPTPTPELFDYPPEADQVLGERAYARQRDRSVELSRQSMSGPTGRHHWDRMDMPLPPGEVERQQQRENELRALQGGLPDAPGEAQASDAGNLLMARFR